MMPIKNLAAIFLFCLAGFNLLNAQNYTIDDTDVSVFYSNNAIIEKPNEGEAYYGQDANYTRNQPSYTDNLNGTVSDNITGLMWEQDMDEKITFDEAFTKAISSNLGGYNDWRVPTLKELYSLILFTGQVKGATAISFFIDTNYFWQPLGDLSLDEREIDAQTWCSTEYVGLTMRGDKTVFGVNFIDGRIKGYPKFEPGTSMPKKMYFRLVRGNPEYGKNNFISNGDGTISDLASGLMWQKADDGISRDWEEALAYGENLELAGKSDWRLPDIKELQSIVDYTRSPQSSSSPAIDPVFETTEIKDPEGGPGHYPYFWSSTSHLDGTNPYASAAYIAFGEGLGKMNETLMDVHGAGCQRSDPKSGNVNDYPQYWGPQGDVRYVYNYVRCVRDISGTSSLKDSFKEGLAIYPNPAKDQVTIESMDGAAEIIIYDLRGAELKAVSANSESAQLNISSLEEGFYVLKINFSDRASETRILTIKR